MVSGATDPVKKRSYNLGSFIPKIPRTLLSSRSEEQANANDTAKNSNDQNSCENEQIESEEMPPERTRGYSASEFTPFPSRFSKNILYRKMGLQKHLGGHMSSPKQATTTASTHDRKSLTRNRNSVPGNLMSPSPTANGTVTASADASKQPKYRKWQCVATKFGTGTVVEFRTSDGFYVVQLAHGSMAFLRPDMIIREIKSIVGERVKTRWGLATVEDYFVDEDMYSIALDWRWDDNHVWRMKATTKKFEKIHTRTSIMRNTKHYLMEGYSSLLESTAGGYATVLAKLNTMNPEQTTYSNSNEKKALTPFGSATIVEARADGILVCQMECCARGYVHTSHVQCPPSKHQFAVGATVNTPYGVGDIVHFRESDETYQIELNFSSQLTVFKPVLFMRACNAHRQLNVMAPLQKSRFSSIFGYASKSPGSSTAATTTPSTAPPKSRFVSGDKLKTPYGVGEVVRFREQDTTYEIQLDFSNELSSFRPMLYVRECRADECLCLLTANQNYRFTSILNTTRRSVLSAGVSLASGGYSTFSTMKARVSTYIPATKPKYQLEERVLTKFGSGFVRAVLTEEHIYVVRLRRLGVNAYLHEQFIDPFPYERVTHMVVDGKLVSLADQKKEAAALRRRQVIGAVLSGAK